MPVPENRVVEDNWGHDLTIISFSYLCQNDFSFSAWCGGNCLESKAEKIDAFQDASRPAGHAWS
jgi:hypothetical protein